MRKVAVGHVWYYFVKDAHEHLDRMSIEGNKYSVFICLLLSYYIPGITK